MALQVKRAVLQGPVSVATENEWLTGLLVVTFPWVSAEKSTGSIANLLYKV